MDNIQSVLDWLTAGGGAVLVIAWAVAWGLEDWPSWGRLDSRLKKLAILVFAILLGMAAKALQLHPGWVEAIRPYLDTLVIIISAWLATQVAHKIDQAYGSPASGDTTLEGRVS